MDRFFALLSAAMFAVMLSCVALFLLIVDARAATVDPVLTLDGPAGASGESPFTLAFTPNRTPDSYTALSLALRVNGTSVIPLFDSLDMVAGRVSFAYALLPGVDLVTAVLDLTYRSGVMSSASITGCATAECTMAFFQPANSPPPATEKQTVTASLSLAEAPLPSVFADPPADAPRVATFAARAEVAAVPIGGTLPLLLSALALGFAARARRA